VTVAAHMLDPDVILNPRDDDLGPPLCKRGTDQQLVVTLDAKEVTCFRCEAIMATEVEAIMQLGVDVQTLVKQLKAIVVAFNTHNHLSTSGLTGPPSEMVFPDDLLWILDLG